MEPNKHQVLKLSAKMLMDRHNWLPTKCSVDCRIFFLLLSPFHFASESSEHTLKKTKWKVVPTFLLPNKKKPFSVQILHILKRHISGFAFHISWFLKVLQFRVNMSLFRFYQANFWVFLGQIPVLPKWKMFFKICWKEDLLNIPLLQSQPFYFKGGKKHQGSE